MKGNMKGICHLFNVEHHLIHDRFTFRPLRLMCLVNRSAVLSEPYALSNGDLVAPEERMGFLDRRLIFPPCVSRVATSTGAVDAATTTAAHVPGRIDFRIFSICAWGKERNTRGEPRRVIDSIGAWRLLA
jgi:hypothetical protein